MDSAERDQYQHYMREGINHLHRLWNEGDVETRDNPVVTGLIGPLLLAGGAYLAYKSGILSTLTSDLGKLTSSVSGSVGAVTGPSSAANGACAAGSYYRSDNGQVFTIDQIRTIVHSIANGADAGYGDTDYIYAYNRASGAQLLYCDKPGTGPGCGPRTHCWYVLHPNCHGGNDDGTCADGTL